jgi:nitrous oxidase accessory protein NosD
MEWYKIIHILRAGKDKSGKRNIFRLLLEKKILALFVSAVFAALSLPAFSNETLRALQRGANNLADGGTLILSRPCEIDGTLLIRDKSNIVIDGNNATITQLNRNTMTVKFENCSNVTIKDLVLIGDPGSYEPFKRTNSVGICMQSCKGEHRLNGVKFYNHGCAGFKGAKIPNITFDKCLFRAEKVAVKAGDAWNCGIWSAFGAQCDNWEVKNCTFEKTAMGMILDIAHNHLNIHDNKFNDIRGQHGIYLNASSYVDIYNNTFNNVYGVAIKLQMNNGHDEIETDINIENNTCDVETSYNMGMAGILIGAAQPQGPARGVFWKNVRIENNRVNRYGYGVSAVYVKDANIINNKLTDTVYGVIVGTYSGGIYDNTITTTKWSGICCRVMDDSRVAIKGNVIKDTVHITTGDIYKRCSIFLTGPGFVELENNEIYRNGGTPLFGLYQGPDIVMTRYRNNRLIGPVALKGAIESQSNNEILQ